MGPLVTRQHLDRVRPLSTSVSRRALSATCVGLLMLAVNSRPASSAVPDGTWLFANRVAVEVFECSGLVCGRIVWLLRPRTPDRKSVV